MASSHSAATHYEHTRSHPDYRVDTQYHSVQCTEEGLKDLPAHGSCTSPPDGHDEKPSGHEDTADRKDPAGDREESVEAVWYWGFTKRQLGVVIMMGLVEFSIQAFLSLLGPFYAVRAEARGVSAKEVGLIFGIVPLVSLLLSPVFGTYIRHIGVKFLLVTGIMTVGCCSILFGFVDWVEDRVTYVVLCLAVRGVEGAGTAAGHTAVYSLLTHSFPERLATMSAFIEAMAAAGFLMGAPIGGALYQAGGFLLPFTLTGGFLLLVGLVLWAASSSPQGGNVQRRSCWRLLWRPRVMLALVNAVGGFIALSFFLFLTGEVVSAQFQFSPGQVSVVYFSAGGCYVLGTLLWSTLIKQWPKAGGMIFSIGFICTGTTMMFWGPAPFMPFHSNIASFFVCACLVLLGLSAELIPYYIVGTEAKEMDGDSLDTSGWIGGILSASFSLGAFIGPVLTGYMYDTSGFPWTCTGVGGMLLLLAFAQLLNHIFSNGHCYYEPPEGEKLPFANSAVKDSARYME